MEKNSSSRPRHVERRTERDVDNVTLHLECLNIANRSMDESIENDADDNLHDAAIGGADLESTVIDQFQAKLNTNTSNQPFDKHELKLNTQLLDPSSKSYIPDLDNPSAIRASTPTLSSDGNPSSTHTFPSYRFPSTGGGFGPSHQYNFKENDDQSQAAKEQSMQSRESDESERLRQEQLQSEEDERNRRRMHHEEEERDRRRMHHEEQGKAEAQRRMVSESRQLANRLISQAASLSDDIEDYMEENPSRDLPNSVVDLDKVINKMEEMRSSFRSKHTELKLQFSEHYDIRLGSACNTTLESIKRYLRHV